MNNHYVIGNTLLRYHRLNLSDIHHLKHNHKIRSSNKSTKYRNENNMEHSIVVLKHTFMIKTYNYTMRKGVFPDIAYSFGITVDGKNNHS